MALSPPHQDPPTSITDNASDYGSDLDDATAEALLSQAESQPLANAVLESIEEPSIEDDSLQHRINLRLSRLQRSLESASENSSRLESLVAARQAREASIEVEYDEGNRVSFAPSNPAEQTVPSAQTPEPEVRDTRSPLERFRKPPKKPLSVTDLVSPAWCEQQYEYNLTKYGRVRRTPAMKQGSSVHKELEEQVHVEVPIEVVTKEDRFGLRIWNARQGLRTLRETGLTRELEVWGVLEGEVIIGIIDEISTTCPDEVMEEAVLEDLKRAKTGDKRRKSSKKEQLPTDQRTLKDFLTSSQNGSVLENNPAFLGTLQEERPPTYYIKDIKTRQSNTLPGPGSQSRPTHMQLMLYHLLLTSLASNEVPAAKIFERYNLDADATFSDKFIAEIANLDIASYASTTNNDGDISPRTTQPQDPLTELLAHNTLNHLWTLLISEAARTFPIDPINRSPPISPLLTAEFRTAGFKPHSEFGEAAGKLIGQRSFPFDAAVIERYVRDEMAWWKGERETKGVEIEEAFKCRICGFAEGCVWRATKVEEGLRKARLRDGRRRSEV